MSNTYTLVQNELTPQGLLRTERMETVYEFERDVTVSREGGKIILRLGMPRKSGGPTFSGQAAALSGPEAAHIGSLLAEAALDIRLDPDQGRQNSASALTASDSAAIRTAAADKTLLRRIWSACSASFVALCRSSQAITNDRSPPR